MKSSLKTTCLTFFLIVSTLNFRGQQIGDEFHYSGKLIEDGIKAYDEKKYQDAIDKYIKVSPCDTSYENALYELCLTYVANKDYAKCISHAKKGLALKGFEERGFYDLLGNSYDELNKTDSSLYYYKQGSNAYPNYYKLFFETGIVFAKLKNDSAALRYFEKSLLLNPLHPGSHLQLAELAARNNNPVCAMFAYQMFELLENSTNRYLTSLSNFEKVINNEYKLVDNPISLSSNGENNFAEYDEIIRSRAAQTASYKTKVKLPYMNFVKQVQVLFEKLKFDPSDKGFFNSLYVPLYVKLWKEDHFEGLVYGLFSGLDKEPVQNEVKKHKNDIDKMAAVTINYIDEFRKNIPYNENGVVFPGKRGFYKSGNLRSVGNENEAKKINTGAWKYFYGNGKISAEKNFNENGQLQGEMKTYFSNGVLKENVNYDNGKANGKYTIYYSNGQIKQTGIYVNDQIEGEVISYFPAGAIKGKHYYKKDILDGEAIDYYETGVKKDVINYKNGKAEGKIQLFYKNGALEEERPYVSDQRSGLCKVYYPSGKIKIDASYKEDKEDGEWKWYWENGNVLKKGFYKNGNQTGNWIEYYENGKVSSEYEVNNNLLEGTYKGYHNSGRLYYESTWSKNNIKGFKYIGLNGQILSEEKIKGSSFTMRSFFPGGTKYEEGTITNGLREGTWVAYYANGTKHRESTYKNDHYEGIVKEYHYSGNLSSQVMYKEGKKHGYYEKYYQSGEKRESGWYKYDQLAGENTIFGENGKIKEQKYFIDDNSVGYIDYFDSNGKLEIRNYFLLDYLSKIELFDTSGKVTETIELKNGNGHYVSHFSNKKLKQECDFKYGHKTGKSIMYYSNGNKNSEESYVNGQTEGDYKKWHSSGQVQSVGYYLNDELDSIYKVYEPTGELSFTTQYKNGEKHGSNINYYLSGKIEKSSSLRHGDFDGNTTYYAEDGTVLLQLTYDEGILISYKYSGKDGRLSEEQLVKNETFDMSCWFANGKKAIEGKYINGQRQGKYIKYYPTGLKRMEVDFVNDDYNGKYFIYHPNGKVKFDIDYKGDDFNGWYKEYNQNGILVKETYYIMDSKYGPEKIYDATGKLIKKTEYVNDEAAE